MSSTRTPGDGPLLTVSGPAGFSHAPASGPGLLKKNRSPRRIAATACYRLQGALRCQGFVMQPAFEPFEDTAHIIAMCGNATGSSKTLLC